jgi:thiol-disulfide isomerase/thioredoxin
VKPQQEAPSSPDPNSQAPAANPGAGEPRRSNWQVPALVLLAVVAVAAGFYFGRGLLGSSTQPVATSQALAPTAPPAAVTPQSAVAQGVPEVASSAAQVAANIASPVTTPSDQGAAMPGISPSEVVTLEPTIHVLKGQAAPELVMTDLASGQEVSLADFKGRPVLVNFWATWCVPCRIEMPWLQAVRDEHAAEGFEVLAVDAGEKVPPSLAKDHIERYVDSLGLTLPVLYGDNTYAVQKAWTVIGLPISFLIGRDGVVVDAHTGGYPNQVTLDAQVQQLIARP